MLPIANIFQPLIDVFQHVITFFHNSLGVPWGWAIVLLTVVIRAVLLPLTVKQFHSMQRMQRHMPELKAIQTKYKEDKQRQQQEMMKFYKENQINPFGSCLPLVLQLPVFISLFYMLRASLRKDICPQTQSAFKAHYLAVHGTHTTATVACGAHNGAGFLFITDLTAPAVGVTLIVLIVLYVVSMLGSSLMMSTPTMDKNQRLMMMFLPLVFVLFIIRFPAGVLVYWITTNLWTIGQGYIIRRRIGPVTPGPSDGSGGGRGGGPSPGDGPSPDGNGAGGIAAVLRGKVGGAAAREPAVVGAPARRPRTSAPPPSPRKKKKRSGRRR